MTTATGPGSPQRASANACAHDRGNLVGLLDCEDRLGHGSKQLRIRQFMDLKRPVFSPACHIADDGDQRNAIEERLAQAGERVRHAWPRDRRQHTHLAGASRVAIRHHGRGVLVRHQHVAQAARLHGVPELVVLGARDAENTVRSLAKQRLDQCLRSRHLATNPARLTRTAQDAGCRRQRVRQGDQRPDRHGLEKLSTSEGKRHALLHERVSEEAPPVIDLK